jgi:hypothetical protein
MLVAFGEHGIKSIEDLADCATDDLDGWNEFKDGVPHTLPKGVHSLCALKKPKFLPQYVSPMLEKLELSIDERSLTWIRQHC